MCHNQFQLDFVMDAFEEETVFLRDMMAFVLC